MAPRPSAPGPRLLYGLNVAKTLFELKIQLSMNTLSSGRRPSSDNAPAVAVHLERNHRVRHALPVVVEEEQRVHERMTERMVQGLVRVREIEAFLDQSGDEMLRGLPVPLVAEHRVLRLIPRVRAGR